MASTTLLDSLRNANLLPSKAIPETFTPIFSFTITFPSISPSNGRFVRASEVQQQPTISLTPTYTSSSSSPSFTFMLIDPDAPTPDDPKFGYWRHWVVTNIPFDCKSSAREDDDIIQRGRTLTPFLAPGPKDESGPHRYLFLLFEEPEGLRLEREDVGGEEFVERRSFRAEEFVEKHGLELVGMQWMTGVGDGWKEGKDEL